jgi:hypothetical protein
MPLQSGTTLVTSISQGANPVVLVRQGSALVWEGNTSTHTLVVISTPGTSFASFSGTGDGVTPLTGHIGGAGIHSSGAGITLNRDATLKVNRAGTLRWDCTASSEASYDFGRLIIGGAQQFQISGTANNAGTATVTTATSVILRFSKDVSVSSGTDRMLVNSLYVANAPGSPTGLAGTAAASSVAIGWSAPADDGNAPITDYAIQYGTSTATFTTFADSVSTAVSAVVTGLTPSTEYVFRVAAVNQIGTGSYGTSITATTLAPSAPAAPSGLTASPDYESASLSWTAPGDGGSAITDYLIEYSANGGTSWTTYAWSESGTSEYIYGLTSGTEYTFRVSAVNSVGTGPPSATATATPY